MTHHYTASLRWTGNLGAGTSTYRGYSRDHELAFPGKAPLPGSSDPMFRGDPSRYNPEDLLVASLAACHMLWYLHLCADAGVVVEAYEDPAHGELTIGPDGGGEFAWVELRPRVTLRAGSDAATAQSLHTRAHELCFIARSVNFPVRCAPEVVTAT